MEVLMIIMKITGRLYRINPSTKPKS